MRQLSPKKLWARAKSMPLDEPKQYERINAYIIDLVKHGHLKVDLNGYYGGQLTEEVQDEVLGVVFHGALELAYPWDRPRSCRIDPVQCKELTEQWIERPTKENFIKMYQQGISLGEMKCWISGRKIYWHFDGETIAAKRYHNRELRDFVDIEPFPFKDGHYPQANYTIPVPSGKLALFQWIEDTKLVKDLDISERKVCSEAGRIAYSRYFENLGFWHLFIGGHGRELYQKGDEYLIFSYNDETSHKVTAQGWKLIGEISFDTDLRWFTACDASKLKPAHYKKDKVLVLDVPPGNYTLTDLMERVDRPEEQEDWCATFKRTS